MITCDICKNRTDERAIDFAPMSLDEWMVERLHYLPPSADRWKLRSTTYQGIADAMAEQWSERT